MVVTNITLVLIYRSATTDGSPSSAPLHPSVSDGVFSTNKSKKLERGAKARSTSGEGGSPPGSDGAGAGINRRANSLKALLRNPFNRSSRSSDSESSQGRLSSQSLPSPPTSPGDFILEVLIYLAPIV